MFVTRVSNRLVFVTSLFNVRIVVTRVSNMPVIVTRVSRGRVLSIVPFVLHALLQAFPMCWFCYNANIHVVVTVSGVMWVVSKYFKICFSIRVLGQMKIV